MNIPRIAVAPHGLTALLLAASCASALSAAEVHLHDGRVIDGDVVSEPGADVIRVTVTAGTMTAIQSFPARDVARIVSGTSPRQQALADIAARRASLGSGGSAEEWWALAQAASRASETVAARELATQVVARDRGHAEARKMLGQVRHRGIWMRPNEVAIARGLIRHDGKWMGWDDREASIAAETRRRQEVEVARQQRIAQRREAAIAAATAASPGEVAFGATPISDPYRTRLSNVRVVYWPTCAPVVVQPQPYHQHSGLEVHAAGGGGSSFRWAFDWHL